MKTYFTLLTSLFLVIEAHAIPTQAWTYDMLNDKATLLVIAVPTNVIYSSTGRGIETSFKVLTVLKGERNIGQLVLHHYALSPAATSRGPLLVPYKPEDKKQFLMFLQKEADGRYVAVSGMDDPDDSIKQISEFQP